MSKIKKILCMLLVCTMIITACPMLVSVSANSEENNSEPLKIEVTTDKSSYSAYGIAEITVKVANTSDETVNNISAEAVFNDLAPVGKNNETFKEVESLQSGESFSFSYKATVNASKVKINFFEKIILWFVRLFNGGYTATSHNIEADTENITEIKFGKYIAENVVKVGYEIESNDSEFDLFLEVTPFDIIVGQETTVLFTAKIVSKDKIKDNISVYDENNNFVVNLNDEGKNGDKKSNDGIYSSNYILISHEEKFVNYSVMVDEKIISNQAEVFFYTMFTEEELSDANNFELKLDDITKKYKNTDGYINEKDIEEYLLEAQTLCENEKTVKSYSYDKDNDSLYIELHSGMTYLIVPPVEGRLAGGTANQIVTFEPYKTSIQTYMTKVFFGIAGKEYLSVSDTANNIKKHSSDFVYENRFENEDVTIEALKSLSPFKLLIWNGHGGYSEEAGIVALMTSTTIPSVGTEIAPYTADIKARRIVRGSSSNWTTSSCGITSKFIDTYFPQLNQSIVYLGACYSCANSSIADSLKLKGASAVYGYNISVQPDIEVQLRTRLFDVLCSFQKNTQRYPTVQQAYDFYYEDNKKFGFVLHSKIPNSCLIEVETGNFSAWVENRSTGTPIEGVEVSIYLESDKDKADKNIYTYTTNENGAIKATLPVGKYIADFTYGEQKAQTTFTIEKDVNYILQNPVYLDNGNENLVTFNVTDNNGNALQNVTVSTLNKGTNQTNSVIGNSGLSLTLSAGTYEITVSKDGYQSVTQTITQSDGAINRVLNITLSATDEPDTEDYGTLTETGSCGANAFYDFYEETGTLVIRGEGAVVYPYGSMPPWNDFEDKVIRVKITKGISSIKDNSFKYCNNIEKIEVDINNEYFSSDDCGVLFNKNRTTLIRYPVGNTRTCYNIPDSVKIIKDSAFMNGVYVNEIKIPDSVNSIDVDAFYGCSGLTSVVIPNSVTSIGDYAFQGCSSLASITLPESVTSIGCGAFRDTAYYNNSNNWVNEVLYINNCVVNSKVSDSKKICEILSGTRLIASCAFAGCDASSTIVLPDSVIHIGYLAFANSSFSKIILGNGLAKIGDIFGNCFVAEISIGDNVTEINNDAFDDCILLFNITVSENNKYYSSDKGVLFDKNKTTLIKYPRMKTNTSYEIPSSVIRINDGAFTGNFKLTDVYYTGTKEEWEKISIGSNNGPLTNATIHYNS